ncbi:uncharacterized protein G2W53_007492 [Senna tora]|uniref:BAR domain-containing protein n=1 Tax=Senna tora TaxID=362788 RepID=A0A835CFR4_9FABA|nr:uncharacterized protein G2W53_007492 [Senna tora]
MKTSLKKLRGLALHHHKHHDSKGRGSIQPLAQLDELAQASQARFRALFPPLISHFLRFIYHLELFPILLSFRNPMPTPPPAHTVNEMQDMRDCYDSLLSAAAATANSAYEFSESLRELGSCLLQKTALNDDEESGKLLLMLGKMQFKLQKHVDNYRGHIFQTITTPSESLMNELRTVEQEMKRQCDEKREVYEHMITRYKERGKSRSGKAGSFTLQQLQTARDEYDEDATLFVFRLKSLKQGQSRSLLTQAARHHAAQLCFFKNALKSLETVEPRVKSVTERQHIDYHFNGLEDDDGDDGEDDDEVDDENDDGELSLDYGQNEQELDVSTSRNSMELLPYAEENIKKIKVKLPIDQMLEVEKSFPVREPEKLDRFHRNSLSFRARAGTQSAPLFMDSKPDLSEKLRLLRPSLSRKFSSYVLPTPRDAKSSTSLGSSNLAPSKTQINLNEPTKNLWHSSPLEQKKYEKVIGDERFSAPTVTNAQSVLKESNSNTASTRFPPPLIDGLLPSNLDPIQVYSKKIKRQAFSGPLTSNKPMPTKPVSSAQLFSGPLLRTQIPQPPLSPKISPSASPTFTSSPKISELHELPRPPVGFPSNSPRLLGLVGHSGPLVPRGQKLSAANKSAVSSTASPLPTPPQAMARSFSIPSSSARAAALQDSRPLEAHHRTSVSEDVASPMPVALHSSQPSSDGSETDDQAV